MEDTTLKGCPFCGEVPKIEIGDNGEGFADYYIDHCCDKEPYIDSGVCDSNKHEVIRRWNTRGAEANK